MEQRKQSREVKVKIRVNRDGAGCHSQCRGLVSTDEGWVCIVFSMHVGDTRADSMRCEECKASEIK